MGELSLIVRRTIRAEVERVFQAWTDPAQLEKWWGPRDVRCTGAEIDLRVGGRYRIGNQLADGKVVWIEGVFEAIDPPHRLIYSWQVDSAGEAVAERVTVHFESRGAETEVIVLHERIATDDARKTHQDGWTGCLDGLAALFG